MKKEQLRRVRMRFPATEFYSFCGRYWDRTSDPFHVKEAKLEIPTWSKVAWKSKLANSHSDWLSKMDILVRKNHICAQSRITKKIGDSSSISAYGSRMASSYSSKLAIEPSQPYFRKFDLSATKRIG